MVYVWEKYKLILTGMEIAQMGDVRTKRVIEVWAEESGVMNVPKFGVIEALVEIDKDWIVYTAHFDSSAWTGLCSP